MGLFDRLGLGKSQRRAKAARAKELAGDLAAATALYLEAKQPDDAARVLLLRADAERNVEKRIAFCASAAETAASPEMKRRALGRKAKVAFDVLRAKGGAPLRSEIARIAGDLEAAGELELAADAFALAGDADGEVRALTAAGAIERLEERLRVSASVAREDRERDTTLRRIADLDRTAERRAALALADTWLRGREDDAALELARAIRGRLLQSPAVEVEIAGERMKYALGREVTIGRGDASILISSPAVSRRHVRLRREGRDVVLEDMGTRNGTTLAGARLAGPIPVGEGVEVLLGGEVPCRATPRGDEVVVEVAGEHWHVPLGRAKVGPWLMDHQGAGEGGFVVLETPAGAPRPYLEGFELAPAIELCRGDAIRASRNGEIVLRALGDATGTAGA